MRYIQVELDGVVATAELLDHVAPTLCRALWAILPLHGPVTNTIWSGQMLRFWGTDGRDGEVPLGLELEERGEILHWPGYVYWHPARRGIRICYGDAQQGGPAGPSPLVPIARFVGDWTAWRRKAQAIPLEGAKPLIIRRGEIRPRRIEVELAEVRATVVLLEEIAPRTCHALWKALPVVDRAVHVKWSGDAWRTEGDYALTDGIENEGQVLSAGDLIFYPRMKKIGLAYGVAQWRHPDPTIQLHVSVIGRVERGLEDICAASQRVWTHGVQPVTFRRVE
jgi:hypothetical protein